MIRRTRKRTDGPAEEVGVRLGEGLHLLLAVQGRARGRRHGRDERRGAREREGGDDLLHRSGSAEGKGRVILSSVAARRLSLSLLVSAQPQRLGWAPGDRDRSVGAEWVPRPPQAAAALWQVSEASPPANWNRCRASARALSDSQPIDIDYPNSSVSGPLAALVGSVDG